VDFFPASNREERIENRPIKEEGRGLLQASPNAAIVKISGTFPQFRESSLGISLPKKEDPKNLNLKPMDRNVLGLSIG
jgi:hypothetical protein